MGLDAIELVMEVEEAFGIKIPDSRASAMRTVGDLYSFVLDETRDHNRDPNSCLSAATFYAFRGRLLPHVKNASSIRPRTSVNASLPVVKRRRIWAGLEHEMDLRFPRLCRPAWITFLASVTAFLVWMGVFIWLAIEIGPVIAALGAIVALVISAALLAWLTSHFAIFPGRSFETYRGLVGQLVALNYSKLSERYASWSPTDVWNVLQLIIVEQLGVKPVAVTPNANFVIDVGVK